MSKKKETQPTETFEDRQAATEENRKALIEQDIKMHGETDEKSPVDPSVRNSPKF